MNATQLLEHFDRLAEAPDAVPRLRRFILDLAVRGKLVEQDARDEPASELLKRIQSEKARLVKAGSVKATKQLPEPEAIGSSLIPTTWRWTRLAEVGFISPRNTAAEEHVASFVPMPMIAADYGVPHRHEERPWQDMKTGYTHFAEGDVGLAKITPCFENGKSTVFRGLTNGIGAGTTELHIVRPVLLNADYILIYLKSSKYIANGIPRMTGTAGQKRVPTEYFTQTPFPLPPLTEQHRIVAKVDELMALCDQLEAAQQERERRRDRLVAASLQRLNRPAADTTFDVQREHARFHLQHLPCLTTRAEHIKAMRQTILNIALRGKLSRQNKDDEPVALLFERLQLDIKSFGIHNRVLPAAVSVITADAEPYPVPSGWRWTRLASLCRVVTDGDHLPPPKSEEGVAFLTIGNVSSGALSFANSRYVSQEYFDKITPYRRPEAGDLLYTVVGASYGRPVIVETNRPFCVQRHIAILKPAAELQVKYLHLLLSSPFVYDQATACLTGTAQPTIPLRPLRDFLVPLPPLAEQLRIVAKVDELMALCDQLEAQLSTTRTDSRRLLESVLEAALAPV
jgi:type I restriction enzyme S subunit